MTWDLIDPVITADLDADTDQPARARPAIRQCARNVSLIRQARDAPNGIASLDEDSKLSREAVRLRGFAGIATWRADTEFTVPNGLGTFVEFFRDNEHVVDPNDVDTYPTRTIVPTLSPAVASIRLSFSLRLTPTSANYFWIHGELWKNGAVHTPAVIGYTYIQENTAPTGYWGLYARSAPMTAVGGDYFEVKVIHGDLFGVKVGGYLMMDILE